MGTSARVRLDSPPVASAQVARAAGFELPESKKNRVDRIEQRRHRRATTNPGRTGQSICGGLEISPWSTLRQRPIETDAISRRAGVVLRAIVLRDRPGELTPQMAESRVVEWRKRPLLEPRTKPRSRFRQEPIAEVRLDAGHRPWMGAGTPTSRSQTKQRKPRKG